jgi:F0F1-type ATP synthase membrane subunit c/vacuolar-type H+-ATPase subunit K
MSDIITSSIATRRDLGVIAWALFMIACDTPDATGGLVSLIFCVVIVSAQIYAFALVVWFMVRWVLLDGWVKR